MARTLNKIIGVLLVVIVFLAWSEGRTAATDFASGVGEVTADVVAAVIEFFDGLSENKPSSSDT